MSGFLVVHFATHSKTLQLGEPTIKRFFAAVDWLEDAYSQLPGFVSTELLVD